MGDPPADEDEEAESARARSEGESEADEDLEDDEVDSDEETDVDSDDDMAVKQSERSYTEQNVRDALFHILGQLHLNHTTVSPAAAITKCGFEGLRMARTLQRETAAMLAKEGYRAQFEYADRKSTRLNSSH